VWDSHKTDEKLLGSPEYTESLSSISSLELSKCAEMYRFERHISKICCGLWNKLGYFHVVWCGTFSQTFSHILGRGLNRGLTIKTPGIASHFVRKLSTRQTIRHAHNRSTDCFTWITKAVVNHVCWFNLCLFVRDRNARCVDLVDFNSLGAVADCSSSRGQRIQIGRCGGHWGRMLWFNRH